MDRALHRFYGVGLISISLAVLSIAVTSEAIGAILLLVAAAGLLALASVRAPQVIIAYTRSRQGYRPRFEALYSIVGPFLLASVSAILAARRASDLYFLSAFVTPYWYEYAPMLVYGIVAAMNIVAFLINLMSLRPR